MAESNGPQDNLSRRDRIERALRFVIDEHEMFRQASTAIFANSTNG